MKISNTNKWSCVLDSFAFALSVDPELLIAMIGHRGEFIGFHTQELIEVMSSLGYAVTEIHLCPVSVHYQTGAEHEILFGGKSAEQRFAEHLNWNKGVLLGYTKKQKPHATSWIHNKLHDPATGRNCELLKTDSEDCLEGINSPVWFTPTRFLKVSNIT